MSLLITETISIIPIIRGYLGVDGITGGTGSDTIDSIKDNIIDKSKDFIGISTPGGSSKNSAGKVPENDKKCSNKGITDKGVIKAAKWKAILNGAMLALNTYNALRMAKLQRDLARNYLELAEEHRDYYKNKYRPLEIRLTHEAGKLPKYVRDKEKLNTGQMLISAKAQTAGQIDNAIACTGRYCTGQRAAIVADQLLKQAATESMVAGMGHRFTDKEEITHNNLRWEKREQAMRIGRDIPTEAVSYASLAAGIFGSIGEQAGKAAEGAAGFLGYQKRLNTEYPEKRGPMTVSLYSYKPTEMKDFEFKSPEVYKTEEPTQTIKVMG